MIEVQERVGIATPGAYEGPERRKHLRLEDPFPAKVRGIDLDGNAFDIEVTVGNVSARGFYAGLPVNVGKGSKLSVMIRFSTAVIPKARPKLLSAHGTVRRCEARADGTCGIYAEFEHHVFL